MNQINKLLEYMKMSKERNPERKSYTTLVNYILTNECDTDTILTELTELTKLSDRWISVKDRLPEYGVEVSVSLPNYLVKIQTATYTKVFEMEFVISAMCVTKDVTHWMPLPSPPKIEL